MGKKKNPPAPPSLVSPTLSTIDLAKLGDLTQLNLSELPSYLGSFPEFTKQKDVLGSLEDFSSTFNKSTQNILDSVAPGTMQNVAKVSDTVGSQVRGEIPQDVQDKLFGDAAFRNLQTGIGQDSGMARNLVARDFGQTTMDLQQQGFQNLQSLIPIANALAPIKPADLLFSPADVLARQDANVAIQNQETSFNTNLENYRTTYNSDIENQQRYYNTNIKNQQATANANVANANAMNRYNYDLMKFQNQQSSLGGLGGLLGTVGGAALGARGGPAGMLAGATLGNAFGGGIGQAAGGGGFGGMASGLLSGLTGLASIGTSESNPFGVLSRLFGGKR